MLGEWTDYAPNFGVSQLAMNERIGGREPSTAKFSGGRSDTAISRLQGAWKALLIFSWMATSALSSHRSRGRRGGWHAALCGRDRCSGTVAIFCRNFCFANSLKTQQ